MNNFSKATWCLITALYFLSNGVYADPEIDKKVDALLAKMTLEEKIGQMNQYNGFWDATGPQPQAGDSKKKFDDLRAGLVGSVLNVKGYQHVQEFQKVAVEESRLGIPLIFGLDVIHGHKTQFPIPLAEAASWDMQAIETSARIAAVESSAQGINWTFAPMVDVSQDARWGRVAEGAGEDPYLGSEIAIARVKGFQGDDLSAEDTIAACVKHFAGYGFSEAGRDYNRVDVSPYTLFNTILPPFKAAVDAGARTFMNSFNTLNGVPATASVFLQRDILKGDWGFDGFVVSDWASIQEMVPHGYARDLKHAAELAVTAGSDMDMEGYAYISHLKELVKDKKVDEALIDDSVRRILRVKYELGLFDDPYKYVSKTREEKLLLHDTHLHASRDVARRSIVLLKNEKQLLPLSKKQKGIVVIGALANDKNSPLGTWRISSDDNSAVSLLEGMKQYNANIHYSKGANVSIGKETFADPITINESDRSGFDEAVTLAKGAEVVVMMLGEHGYQSGEGRSRTALDLPGLQQALLEEVYKVNKNIVLLVASGRPLALTWAHNHIPAIVATWQLGSESGNAIADVVFGEYNPSGKLPMSFPRSVGQVPITYRIFSTGRPEPKPVVFWSHYIDESNEPLYPFGHGLSYTTFDYSSLNVSYTNNQQLQVQVEVTNSGRREGEEVVQLYIRDRVASIVRPVKELKGFKKLSFAPGEKRLVSFSLATRDLGFFNAEGQFLFEPGTFDIFVGGSSYTQLKTSVEL